MNTVIEYLGIDREYINNLNFFFHERGLRLKLIKGIDMSYVNPMPYIKIVSLGDDFIEFQAPISIVVFECFSYDEYREINDDINIYEKFEEVFGINSFIIIPVYGKEVDIKVIAKNDYAMGIPSYKRIGMGATEYAGDPSSTFQLETYKSPSQLMLL